MKVLIVGGTSALGIALKLSLSPEHEVITAGRKDCDITIDLSGPAEDITFPDGIDVVIHTAAHFGGAQAEDIIECENVNAVGTLKLCQAAVQAGAKHFILISSMSACVREDSAYFGIYALSKRHSEELAKLFCSAFSLPLTILRPTQIYGNLDVFRRHQPFIYTMADKAANNDDIIIYGSNDALRNYIHSDDLTTIISRVMLDRVEGTYSCVHPEDVTYSGIAKAALSGFNSRGSILFLKDKPDIPDNIFDHDDSLYKAINYFPQISIEEGMKMMAAYNSKL